MTTSGFFKFLDKDNSKSAVNYFEGLDSLAKIMSGHMTYPDALPAEISAESLKATISLPVQIPAGYTYLSQFIAHDISFDARSERHDKNHLPWLNLPSLIDNESVQKEISSLVNKHNSTLDLESVYGSGDIENIFKNSVFQENSPLPLLKLGLTSGGGSGAASRKYPCDLPRRLNQDSPPTPRILTDIPDKRNDENLILAQTHVAFIKFHNALVIKLSKRQEFSDGAGNFHKFELFKKARELAIKYYQTIILTDFLPKIIDKDFITEIRNLAGQDSLFYQPLKVERRIPLEFSVAAFRFGHSMIRDTYNFNSKQPGAELFNLMMFNARGDFGSVSSRTSLPSSWIIDWNSFYEINGIKPNFAEPINTKLARQLIQLRPLPTSFVARDGRPTSLAALDLFRGYRFGLASGQELADCFKVKKISSGKFKKLIETIEIKDNKFSSEEILEFKKEVCKLFSKNTPLWFYILAEAELQGNGKLGELGKKLVGETMIQLIFHSEPSVLQEPLSGEDAFRLNSDNSFGMADMLKFIQETNAAPANQQILYPMMQDKFDELNPLKA